MMLQASSSDDERVFRLNVGGTIYEVPDSLLDQFENSMLRRITSDTWCHDDQNEGKDNYNNDDDETTAATDTDNAIFIERDGERFQYVLEYMKNGKVVVPSSVPRSQLISDMEYYGIDVATDDVDSKIIPDVGSFGGGGCGVHDAGFGSDDDNNVFLKFSEFCRQKRWFNDILERQRKDLDIRYRVLAAKSVSCKIASKFFRLLLSPPEEQQSPLPSLPLSSSYSPFETKKIEIHIDDKENYVYLIEELQAHLNQYALIGSGLSIIDRRYPMMPYPTVRSVELEVRIRTSDATATSKVKGHKVPDQKKEIKDTPPIEGEKGKSACTVIVSSMRKIPPPPSRIKLNVGGIKYEVSDSLLNRFPDSLLRKMTSEATDPKEEIFIERHGDKFKYVLDYMRDGRVIVPFSVLRSQIVTEMEYFGIGFDESQITLSVADPNDMFHKISAYYYDEGRFETIFESKMRDIEASYRKLAVESISCAIAQGYFEKQFSGRSFLTFEAQQIRKSLEGRRERFNYSMDELQPFFNLYGLNCFDVEQREEVEVEESIYRMTKVFELVEQPRYIEMKVTML